MPVPPRAKATCTISGTRDRSNAVISKEILVSPPDGAARAPPKDVCGPDVIPEERVSSFGEKLPADAAAPPATLTLVEGAPPPMAVAALPMRESRLRARSIARSAMAANSSERRGLSLYAGSNTPVHRTTGRTEARSIAGPSARTTKALYARYWRIVTPVEASLAFIAGVTGPLN